LALPPGGPLPGGPVAGRPAPSGPATAGPAPAGGPIPVGPAPSTPEGLPRRVRQASLAPQLRDTPVDDQSDTLPLRSPEQVRTIMNALQRGTTRGRMEAAGRADAEDSGVEPPGERNGAGRGFSEAATVHLPIVRDDQHHENLVSRPEKDDA
jgi:hypothetical protein